MDRIALGAYLLIIGDGVLLRLQGPMLLIFRSLDVELQRLKIAHHEATKGINLSDQGAFSQAANAGVAAHLSHASSW